MGNEIYLYAINKLDQARAKHYLWQRVEFAIEVGADTEKLIEKSMIDKDLNATSIGAKRVKEWRKHDYI